MKQKLLPHQTFVLPLIDELKFQIDMLKSFNEAHGYVFINERISDLKLLIKRIKSGEVK